MIPRLLAFFTFITAVFAATITFELKPDEKACYYIFTEQPGEMVGYYFAVQSGGSFDVDYTVTGPGGKVISAEHKQRQGDWRFKADVVGEYEFCFSNEMSTFAEKVVDFEISIENEFSAQLPVGEAEQFKVDGIVNSMEKIDTQLNGITKALQHYKTRNNRNQATVKSTESRIFYFSIYEVLLCVGMAVLQVTVVHFYFKNSRKQLV
ncbi:Protein ERP3 [Cyberlindnera fabianii]|uniref:Protein ERP3 n=1 Tax=Cyberlindnera fabianii TaxID=36022 RepID=A0A1V2LAX0_CYBFA|nr:Protein ERP3 [Cyberlindnera fabianii]